MTRGDAKSKAANFQLGTILFSRSPLEIAMQSDCILGVASGFPAAAARSGRQSATVEGAVTSAFRCAGMR